MPVIKHMKSAIKQEAEHAAWQGQLLDSLPEALLALDDRHHITGANARALEFLGKRLASVKGRHLASVLRLRDIASGARLDFKPLLARVQSSGQPAHIENCVLDAKHGNVEVSLAVLPSGDAVDGARPVTVVLSEADASGQPLKLRDAILSMVSHELRTPLLHIKGFVSSLLESDIQWDEETRLDFLRTIDRETDRLTAMVSDLMEISRMRTGELPLHLELADPYQLAYTAVDEASPFLRRHRVVVNVAEGLPKVRIDALRVMGVLVNLIENASKYSESGTAITLGAVERDNSEVLFSVADQGIGVPDDIHNVIFEMFYRGSHGGKRPAGTGLGLAVCKAVVEAHHGKIWVESEGNGGSTFYFTLPVAGSVPSPRRTSKRGGISRPPRIEPQQEQVITGI